MTMKLLLVLCGVLVVALAQDKYTNKYDNVNLQEILKNKRLVKSYANCILDKGKCNAEGRELRSHVEEALSNGCEKCTEVQRQGVATVGEFLVRNENGIWKELVAKYDPDSKYRKKYEDLARERGIELPEDLKDKI